MAEVLDRHSGLVEYFHWSDSDDDGAIEMVADVQPHLDFAQGRANDGTNGFSPSRDLRHIAHIPLIVVEKWRIEHGVDVFNRDHWPAALRLLRDPAWRMLRTDGGRI